MGGFNPANGIGEWLFPNGSTNPSSQIGDMSGGLTGILGNVTGAFSKWATGVLPRELAASVKLGLEKAGIGDILGDALGDMAFVGAKMRVLNTFKTMADEMSKSWEKVDQAAFNYGKRVGLASDQVVRLRNEMIQFGIESQTAIKYGKSIDELIKLQSDYSSALGRNIRLTKQQYEEVAALGAVVGDDMAVKFSTQLESFGLSMTDAGELMTKMYNKSVKQGLSLEKYAQSVTDSLHLAQQYTFKNGVSGLTSMAEKAAKMKLDISEAVKLAEKVSSVEGAVDVASQLQVLGGAFTNFADPMGLLYDSLNNMEGMQDRLSELVGQFGSFNRNTGEIEIATFDKLRLKQAASAMGVDYGKLIESATHQAKRGEIEAQMAGLTNIPEEYKEILMNTATFKNGVAGAVGTDGKFTELSKLDGDDLKAIADYSKSDSENIRDIAQMMRGMTDIREGQAKAEEDARTGYFRTQAELIKEGYQKIGENTRVLQQLVQIQFANSLKKAIISPMASVGNQALGKALELVFAKKANGGIIKTHSEGDVITNGTPGKEYVLNSAQYGEFIVNKQSTQHHLGLLKAINADKNGSLKINKHDFGGAIGMPMDNLLLMSSLNGIFRNPSQFLMQNNPFNEVIKTNTQILKELKGAMESLQEGDSYRNELMDSIKELEDKNISLDKLSTKYLSKVPKIGKAINVIGKIGGPMIASVNALSSSISQYKADGTNIIDKGKAVGGTVGSTAGAAIGAALLSFAGPVGMMIGSQIGQIGGKVIGEAIGKGSKARRNRKYGEIEDELRAKNARGANVFGSLKGNFSVREMRKIAAALEDGSIGESELSDNLMEKIKITDNYDNLVNKRYSRGGYIVGKSHGEGGVKMFEAEGGEFIVNKQATAKSLNILTKINDGSINDSNIRAREPMGKQIRVSEHYANNVNEPRSVKMEPLKIDINGTIKLDSGNQSFDLSKELFNNPLFINKLTDIITKQMNINDNGSFNKQTYYQRYSTI